MKKYIPFILPACLILVFSFFPTEEIFSQTDYNGNKMDTASSVGATSDVDSPVPSGITPGRARSLVGAALGLISLILGWRAAGRPGKGRSLAIAALVLGLICIILSIVHLVTTVGGLGTGGGKAGAIVALVLGLVGMILGGLALRINSGRGLDDKDPFYYK
jgi:hypothetical protein